MTGKPRRWADEAKLCRYESRNHREEERLNPDEVPPECAS